MVARDIARRDRSRSLLVQAHLGDVARVHADGDRLQVEQNVDDVFLHPFDGRVFMQHALDLDLGDRRSRQGRQQHPAQRIAERVPEPALEWLDHDPRMARRHRLHLDDPWLQKFVDRTLHGIPSLT
jgi:hypothetical protein